MRYSDINALNVGMNTIKANKKMRPLDLISYHIYYCLGGGHHAHPHGPPCPPGGGHPAHHPGPHVDSTSPLRHLQIYGYSCVMKYTYSPSSIIPLHASRSHDPSAYSQSTTYVPSGVVPSISTDVPLYSHDVQVLASSTSSKLEL